MKKLSQWLKEKAGYWIVKGVLENKENIQTKLVRRWLNKNFFNDANDKKQDYDA